MEVGAGEQGIQSGNRADRKLRIYFASYGPNRAVAHYRLSLQAQALNRAGHECVVGSTLLASPREVIGVLSDHSLMRDLDMIVVQPGVGFDWTHILRSAHQSHQAVVVDLDDWFWDAPDSVTAWQGDNFYEWRHSVPQMVRSGDLVTVSTPFIADQVASWKGAPPIRVLRNAIDPDRWGQPERVDDGPVLGYAGSLYGHEQDVQLFRGWLGSFLERHDLRIIHFGHHPSLPGFAATAGVDPERVDVRPGQPWDAYAPSAPMRGMDIGLVPLVARPFNQAKSALKGMEYAACGVPFVASSSPEYQWFGSGVLVGESFEDQGAKQWVGALERLLDPAERLKLALGQTERLAPEDIAVRWPDWERVYLEAVGQVRPA